MMKWGRIKKFVHNSKPFIISIRNLPFVFKSIQLLSIRVTFLSKPIIAREMGLAIPLLQPHFLFSVSSKQLQSFYDIFFSHLPQTFPWTFASDVRYFLWHFREKFSRNRKKLRPFIGVLRAAKTLNEDFRIHIHSSALPLCWK